MNLEGLFRPKSIAVIGASDKPGMGRGAAEGALQSSVAEHVYLINVKRDEVLGQKSYHSLRELPELVDTIILCVNVNLVNPYLEEAGSLGVKNAVVYASGFSEEGTENGLRLEAEMREICLKYGMLLVGPNCVGLYNKVDRISLYATSPMFQEKSVERGIGAVAHSGYINSNLMRTMPDLCAYGVSVGNAAVCSLEEYMLYYAQNDHVNCIAAYIEGIRNAETFENALRIAAENRKPVVIMKSGRSKKGSAAAASHTGNLAGDYKSFECLLERYGVVTVDSLEEFNATARMFAVLDGNYPAGNGIGAVNFSGGENTICADFCEKHELSLPSYEDKTREIVAGLIPAFSTARNPLDPTTEMFTKKESVKEMFSAIFADNGIDLFVLGLELAEKLETKDFTCLDVLEELAEEGKSIPTFLVPSFEKDRNHEALQRMQRIGIPMLATGELAYKMLHNLCEFVSYDPSLHTLELATPKAQHGKGRLTLSEADSKEEISRRGVPIPGQFKAACLEELREKLSGVRYPLVLKVDSPDIPHKTEAGGVALNLKDQNEVEEAFERVMHSCRSYRPDARIDGVLIQEMVPAGTEMIVGVKNDPVYGPMLLCGMGGVFVEIFKDATLSPCPMNHAEAGIMLKKLKAYRLLCGYRGSLPCDVDALCDLMVNLSQYAAENRDSVAEIDLNPVFVYEKGKGVMVADALIVKYAD